MPAPNQITACASSSRQGVYRPEVHMYAAAPHPRYGLLPDRYFFAGRTRDRGKALAIARSWIAAAKGLSPVDARAFLAANHQTALAKGMSPTEARAAYDAA